MEPESGASDSARVSCVVLFTLNFPFGWGEAFLAAEIGHLAASFDRVIIVPTRYRDGMPQTRTIPEGVSVLVPDRPGSSDLGIVVRHAVRHPFDAGASLARALGAGPSPSRVLEDLKFDLLASAHARTMGPQLADALEGVSQLVFYGYWLNTPTRVAVGIRRLLGLLDVPIVSRAHGFDFYTERHRHNYLPQRKLLLESVHRVFTASRAGEHYLRERYPRHGAKFTTAHLGTTSATNPGNAQRDALTVVSCSSIVALKRLPLLIDDLAEAQKRGLRVRWSHIGVGARDYEDEVRRYAEERLSAGSFTFVGPLINSEVRSWLGAHPASVFVSVSESEGGVPVSIMEALAQGLPVIATTAGGTSELGDSVSGIFDGLLPVDHTANQFADRLERLLKADDASYRDFVSASLDDWRRRWSSDTNYSAFAEGLREIAGSVSSNRSAHHG